MATTSTLHPSASTAPASESQVLHSIYVTLRTLFVVVPIVAGLDKFFNFLVHWEDYLNPLALRIVPVSDYTFMHIVGVIEVIAGIIVWARPRVGGYIVMAWMIAIALQLLMMDRYLDVAVRDLVIALGGALSLARLTPIVDLRENNLHP
jgi:hypothetical protein